jgi:hypothetical protein
MDDPGREMHEGEHHGTSRRWFLAGGAAVLLGAGAGLAAEFATHEKPAPPQPPTPPRALVDAIAAERALLTDLAATTGGSPAVRAVIRQIRADHATHLMVLTDLVASYGVLTGAGPASSASSASSPAPSPSGTPRTRAALRDAERRASAAAARHADALTGGQAALLASIAAAEATHADLLT